MDVVLALMLGGIVGAIVGIALGFFLCGAVVQHFIDTSADYRQSLQARIDKAGK